MKKRGIQIVKKLVSWCVAVGMLLTTQGVSVLTENVNAAANGEEPADPVHHCDEDTKYDWTRWDYVYFGSYPQTEVTDPSLKKELDNAEFDENNDTWIGSEKYRRAKNFYNDYDYFKWEEIKWRVLMNNGSTMLRLMSDQILDCTAYNDTEEDFSWENSSVRKWLNDTFYTTAFDEEEQNAILVSNIKDASDDSVHKYDEINCSDYIYLLSSEDVVREAYGFCEKRLYYVSHENRNLPYSDYAHMSIIYQGTHVGMEDTYWWLRSASSENKAVGMIYQGAHQIDSSVDDCLGVVPVVTLDLTSDAWSLEPNENAGSGDDSGEGGNEGESSGNAGEETGGKNENITGPKNPIHTCTKMNDGTDTTEWSHIYFGMYPQSEVTGDELTQEIINAKYDADNNAVVDGVRYHRLSKNDAISNYNFGDAFWRYFKWEKIKWRVLSNNGETLFVMADNALEISKFSESEKAVKWGTYGAQISAWLYEDFYALAFTSEEQADIVKQTVVTNHNIVVNAEEETQCKIYLLSSNEVLNADYGFCDDFSVNSDSRRIQRTPYTQVKSGRVYDSSTQATNMSTAWWLRSAGGDIENPAYASYVDSYGSANSYGDVYSKYMGVVPVMHIDANSTLWTSADDASENPGGGSEETGGSGNEGSEGTGGETTKVPANPVHTCTKLDDGTDVTEWSYVYFGSYPQTEVTGEALTTEIIDSFGDTQKDSSETGTKYRRVSVEDTNDDGNFGDSTYRYYKWDKIKWRVLENDGNTLLLMADTVLEGRKYHEADSVVTWENSTLRTWLNEDFYNQAFNELEREDIIEQTVVNADNGSMDAGNDTQDKVSILSLDEVQNAEYGFCSDDAVKSESRKLRRSEYAQTLGVMPFNGESSDDKLAALWWLRTPGGNRDFPLYNSCVNSFGYANAYEDVYSTYAGVVPIIRVDINSELWSVEENGAGSGNENTGGGTAGSGDENTGGGAAGSGNENTGGGTEGSGNENTGGGITGSGNENTGGNNTGNIFYNSDGKVTQIALSASSTKVVAGKKVKIKANVYPKTAINKNILWYSGNPKYATVNSKGVVTTKKTGAGKRVYIIATAADGGTARAAIRLDILGGYVTSVKIKNAPKTLKVGRSIKLKTTVKFKGKNVKTTLKWTTSNKKYATVNSKGKVTAKKNGKGKIVTITACSMDGTNKKARVRIKIK